MNARWMRRAERDRTQIFDYIEQRNASGAISTDEEIERVTELLAAFPHLEHRGRVSGTLEFDVTKQIIVVYRIRPKLQAVEFLRLIHTRRKYI